MMAELAEFRQTGDHANTEWLTAVVECEVAVSQAEQAVLYCSGFSKEIALAITVDGRAQHPTWEETAKVLALHVEPETAPLECWIRSTHIHSTGVCERELWGTNGVSQGPG